MTPNELTTQLCRAAGRAEPPPIDAIETRRLVERAMRAEPRRERRRWPRLAMGMVIAAVAVAWLAWPHEAEPRVLELALPTGDHLAAVAGARFEVEADAPAHRRIRLHAGEVMFDVAHVVPGQRFEVATDHLVATAKGTVFSVAVDGAGSHVRVFDGVVAIEQAGRTHLLFAGGVWESTRSTTALAFVRPAQLAPNIERALAARVPTPPPAPAIAAPVIPVAVVAAPPARRAKPASPPPPPAISTSPSASPWSTDSVPLEQMSLDQLLATARGQLASSSFDAALATADLAAKRAPWSSAWWQLIGDARRGRGQIAAAASAFDHVTGPDLGEAGYTAAYLRHHDLHDDRTALATLDASRASIPGAPLEERALGLRAQILVALGRRSDAAEVARRYLARFPHADLRSYMASLLPSASAQRLR